MVSYIEFFFNFFALYRSPILSSIRLLIEFVKSIAIIIRKEAGAGPYLKKCSPIYGAAKIFFSTF